MIGISSKTALAMAIALHDLAVQNNAMAGKIENLEARLNVDAETIKNLRETLKPKLVDPCKPPSARK